MIRGFAANSLLIMMDGIRINNAIYRSGNLQNVIMLDPNMLSSSEIIFGPGSSVYGSDALGGVMDFHTLKPSFNKGNQWSGSVMTRYSSANHEKTGHVDLTFQKERINNIIGFTYSDFGDLRMGSNRTDKFPDFGKRVDYVERVNGVDELIKNDDVNIQRQTGYHQYNLMNKLSFRISDDSQITHTLFYTTSGDVPRYDRLTQRADNDTLRYAKWYYGPQKFLLNAVTFSNYSTNQFYDGMKVIASMQRVEESRHDRRFGSASLRSRTEEVDVYAFNIDFDKKFSADNELFYGAEWVRNDVRSVGISTDIETGIQEAVSPRYPDLGSVYSSMAIYASHKKKWKDRLVLSSGLRISNVSLLSKFGDQFYSFPFDEIAINSTSLSGTLGLVFNPNDQLKLNAVLSTGFRSPNVDDAGKIFDSEPGHVVVPNEGLTPEQTYNAEIGLDWKIGDRLTIDASVYYIFLRNAMVRDSFLFNGQDSIIYDGELSAVEALVNTGRAYVFGYSFGFAAKLSGRFSFKGRVNDNTGEDLVNHEPLRHTTPRFGELALHYKTARLRTDLNFKFQSARSINDFAPSELSKDFYTSDGALGWYTLNLKSSYQWSDSFTLTAAVENILDQHYRPYSSGISAPGINGVVSARFTF